MEGLIYGTEFASQNRLGYPYSWKKIYRFCMLCVTLYLRAISKYKPLGGLYLEGDLTEGFLRYVFGGLCLERLIHGGAYFQNFMVSLSSIFSIPDRKDTPFTCCFKI